MRSADGRKINDRMYCVLRGSRKVMGERESTVSRRGRQCEEERKGKGKQRRGAD